MQGNPGRLADRKRSSGFNGSGKEKAAGKTARSFARTEKEGKMKKILAVLAVSCTVMLFAACQDKTYDVTFMVDGAQYGETLTVKEGETVTLPAAPQKEGYHFIDWYEADAEEAFDDASAVSRDYTLSAKFEENVYTLSFDGGDAEGEMSSVELTYTQEYTLPACTYEWTDHAFVGWALDADGEMTYADGAKVSKLTAEHEAEVTLYAVWSEQYYTVSFDGGDGLGSMQSVKVPMSGKVSLPANAFVKEGWHFAGWATQENGEAVYTDGAEISALTQTVGGSVTLYAVWEEDYYLVRYNANGGEGTMAEQKVKLSETAALTANAFTKEGYTFVGWATSADGEAVYDDAEQVTALASQNGAVVELYAVWRGAPETYTVVTKIQQADGSFTETSEQKDSYFGETVSATAEEKTGYESQILNNNAVLDGGNDTVITIEYTLKEYTVTVTGVYGTKKFEAAKQTFTYLTETFAADVSKIVEVDGASYKFVSSEDSLTVEKNTAENVFIEARYAIGVSTAEEFADVYNNKHTLDLFLENDIDFTEYFKTHSFSGDTPYFFCNWNDFTGTLDGNGHSLTGLTRGINGDGTYTYNRHYGFFGGMAGTFKNVYIQMELAVNAGEGGGFTNGAIIQTLKGTLENCIFDVTLHYYIDWGAWDCGLFDSVENTAVVRDCVFIVNNHTPGALFARNQADFTVENVAFIGNYNIEAENLLRGTSDGKPHTKMKYLYVFTSMEQAVQGGGYALKADYAQGSVVCNRSIWEDNTSKLSELFAGMNDVFDASYTVVTKTETSEGVYEESSRIEEGALFTMAAVTAEEKEGFVCTVSGDNVLIDGNRQITITVQYSYPRYTATLTGVSGNGEFEIESKVFMEKTEGFTMQFPEEVTVNGVTYLLVSVTDQPEVPANAAQNMQFRAEYKVEVSTAEELVNAMKNAPQANIVLVNDIDLADYLAANPWNSRDTSENGAFFNVPFSGVLDGQGYSVTNLISTAGLVDRYLNTVFREISEKGIVKNLHIQAYLGLSAGGEGARMGLFIGNLYGTVENCFFEIHAEYNVDWYMYGAAPIYNLGEKAAVRNTVFYIPNTNGLRMICSTGWGQAFEGYGVFDKVAFVYGNSDVNNSLPTLYNPNITNIYIVRADKSAGEFNDAKALNSESYKAAETGDKNSKAYWDATSFEAITAAMDGFTFTANKLMFGEKVIADYDGVNEVSNAYDFVTSVRNHPAGSFKLTQDIDMNDYLQAYPWNWTDVRAFFDASFSGTLDGQGHSVLNFTSTAGLINRWENAVFREITEEGVVKNVHLQVSLGVTAFEGQGRAILFGNMYGTIENCFFEIDVQTDSSWGMYGASVFYRLAETSSVKNTVFYIPNSSDFRLMCANTGTDALGTFENVTYVCGGFNMPGLLPNQVNPNISGINLIKVDETAGTFSEVKTLKADYATGSTVNDASLWEDSTFDAVNAAMSGFTFSADKILFGETVIRDYSAAQA